MPLATAIFRYAMPAMIFDVGFSPLRRAAAAVAILLSAAAAAAADYDADAATPPFISDAPVTIF